LQHGESLRGATQTPVAERSGNDGAGRKHFQP
jgi:hypothetical protein